MPELWADTVREWAHHNDAYRRSGWPDRNSEYLLYQTLVGAHPLPFERAWPYMEKAVREAKANTTWTEPDASYEEALQSFLRDILDDTEFVSRLNAFVGRIAGAGRRNALAMTLLKVTSPGIPDIYQGSELWDLSLVDPDNRRPVDFEGRRRLLAELTSSPRAALDWNDEVGVAKLWILKQALSLRREEPGLFDAGASYEPLTPAGARRRHVLAFARRGAGEPEGAAALVVVPRLLGLGEFVWGDTSVELPGGRPWRNRLTGETYPAGTLTMAALFSEMPVALLQRESLTS